MSLKYLTEFKQILIYIESQFMNSANIYKHPWVNLSLKCSRQILSNFLGKIHFQIEGLLAASKKNSLFKTGEKERKYGVFYTGVIKKCILQK